MFYYLFFNLNGRPGFLRESEGRISGSNIIELTEEEYQQYDIESEQELFDLKEQLKATDYIACKIAEGAATREEYADVLVQRQTWRARINELGG